ncbi:MAG: hypothetical protein AB7F36_09205 [Reyranellaceae bacterium]
MGVALGQLSDAEIDALEFVAGERCGACPPLDVVAHLIALGLAQPLPNGVAATKTGLTLLLEAGLIPAWRIRVELDRNENVAAAAVDQQRSRVTRSRKIGPREPDAGRFGAFAAS